MSMVWTPEMDERLRELHAAGVSMGQIASRIGVVSRSSVIGRSWRLGLRRPTKAHESRKRNEAARAEAALIEQQANGSGPSGARDAVEALTAKSCRWPIGHADEATFRFCGAPAPLGRPYCEAHSVMARAAIQPEIKFKRRRAA